MEKEPLIKTDSGVIKLSDVPLLVDDNNYKFIVYIICMSLIICIIIMVLFQLYYNNKKKKNIQQPMEYYSNINNLPIKARYIQLVGVSKKPINIEQLIVNNMVFFIKKNTTPKDNYTYINIDLGLEHEIKKINIITKSDLSSFKIVFRNNKLQKIWESDFLTDKKHQILNL